SGATRNADGPAKAESRIREKQAKIATSWRVVASPCRRETCACISLTFYVARAPPERRQREAWSSIYPVSRGSALVPRTSPTDVRSSGRRRWGETFRPHLPFRARQRR